MYKFKEFILRDVVVFEALTIQQQRTVNSWHHGDHSFSDHAFAKEGYGRSEIPLESDPDRHVPAHPEIEKHLKDHGYGVHDYVKGLAIDNHNRHVSIGKVLEKTKAHKDLKKIFQTDPKRQAIKSDMKVVLSRRPYDVAGMSTDRGWRSCMSMDGGSYKAHLQDDVEHGTHVAYLCHKHDDDINNPVARIALKPFHSTEDNHTILRPEQRMYGHGNDDFAHTVRKWTENNFPTKDGHLYKINQHVYNDSFGENDYVFNKNHDTLDHFSRQRSFTTPNDRKHYLSDDDEAHMHMHQAVLRHGTEDQLNRVMSLYPHHEFWSGKHAMKAQFAHNLGENPNAKDHHIDEALEHINNGDWGAHVNAMYSKSLLRGRSKDQIRKYSTHENPNVRFGVASINGDHQLDMIHDKDPGVRLGVAENIHADHLHRMMKDEDEHVRHAVAQRVPMVDLPKMFHDPKNPEKKPHEVEPNEDVRGAIIRRFGGQSYQPDAGKWDYHPIAKKHAHKFIDDPDENIQHNLVPLLSREHLAQMTDPEKHSARIRQSVAYNMHEDDVHLFKNDPDSNIRYTAAHRMKPEHAISMVNDDNSSVRHAIGKKLPHDQLHHMIGHPNNSNDLDFHLSNSLPPEHLLKHAKHIENNEADYRRGHWALSRAIERMPTEHVAEFKNHKSERVRDGVVLKIHPDHLQGIADNEDEDLSIRRTAAHRLKAINAHKAGLTGG